MPQRAYIFLAYRLLTLILNVGLSSSIPVQNVAVVPLARSGESTSVVVLPSGASKDKTKTTPDKSKTTPTSLIEKTDRPPEKEISPKSSTPTVPLLVAEEENATRPTKQTNVNGTQERISKLIQRPSSGKSFFANEANIPPAAKSEDDLGKSRETDPKGSGGGDKKQEGQGGAGIGVKLLSEKPLITAPSDNAEKKPPGGTTPPGPKTDSQVSGLPAPGGKPQPEVQSKPSAGSSDKAKKPGGTGDEPKAPTKSEGETIPKKKDDAGNGPETKGSPTQAPDTTGKNPGQPLPEKAPTATDHKAEANLAPVRLSQEPNTENLKPSESQAGLNEEKGKTEKPPTPASDTEGNLGAPSSAAHKSTPHAKSAPETSDKATASSPPAGSLPEAKGKTSAYPASKASPPEAQNFRKAENMATTLSVVKNDKDPEAPKEKPTEENPSKMIYMIGAGVAGFLVLLFTLILFAKKKKKKEAKLPEGGEKFNGVQSEVPIGFGSGEGANEITMPLSPPMSLSGKSQRGIPVTLPMPRGDEDLSGGKSLSRQLRGSNGYERNYSTSYGSQYGRDNLGPYENNYPENGSAYHESEFYDNSRYRAGRDSYRNQSSGRISARQETGRFPYSRR